jgi:hypothetical protein
MSARILYDAECEIAALYCSTSEVAFGPLFHDRDGYTGDERACAFCRWLETISYAQWQKFNPMLGSWRDARLLPEAGLERAYGEWLAQEAEQWLREDSEDGAA